MNLAYLFLIPALKTDFWISLPYDFLHPGSEQWPSFSPNKAWPPLRTLKTVGQPSCRERLLCVPHHVTLSLHSLSPNAKPVRRVFFTNLPPYMLILHQNN